jgi:hypothetical protein
VSWQRLAAPAVAVAIACVALACSGGSAAPGGDDGGEAACMPINPPSTCPSPPPSYKSDISFIVANDCAVPKCHSSGGLASVRDFTTYKGLYGDHGTVAMQVSLCPMASSGMPPPGYPQPTAAQRLALVTWASICGAPDN